MIFADLKALHEKALRHGACTIAVTIPEGGNTVTTPIQQYKMMARYCSEQYLYQSEEGCKHSIKVGDLMSRDSY